MAAELHQRLVQLAERISPGQGARLGAQLALLIDGMYVNAAHLGQAPRPRQVLPWPRS